MSKKLFDRNVPGKLFKPTFRREARQSAAHLNKPEDTKYTYAAFKDTNLFSTSSYRYGDKDYLVSTQQANVDFSKFENHTFFHSAVANVNEAFDRIVNFYPFDGTKKDIEEFEDTLTGFEKYVFNSFPKNVGYLVFSGSKAAGSGNYIEVVDRSGAAINSISDDRSGKVVMDPASNPFTIEFFYNAPELANDNQVIAQKRSSLSNSITIALSQSNSTSTGSIIFGVTSGSNYSYVTGTLYKGSFNHVAAIYDIEGDQKTKLIIDDVVYSSSMSTTFSTLHYSANSLYIGTGSQVRLNNLIFDPQETLSGAMDTFRFYHVVKDRATIKDEKTKDVYASSDLKLQLRFNEPSGSYTGNDIVLDSSGNSLHGIITNFDSSFNRTTGSNNPTGNECVERSIVLFPDFPQITALNTALLTTGSEYDTYNPNLITKLIPPHYFEESNYLDNFDDDLGKLGEAFSTFTDFNVGKKSSDLPGASLLVKFLLIWAKAFDELKITIDTISNFNHVKYEDYESVPDPLLRKKAESINIRLPSLFRNSEQSQLIEGINLSEDFTNATKSLNDLQNLIWRRILSDTVNMRNTKGTIGSLKSVFRSAGMEPDNILAFREYGGSRLKSLNGSRERKVDVLKFLNFSGSMEKTVGSVDNEGYPDNFPKIKSGYLSSSRVETGVPLPGPSTLAIGTIEVEDVSTITDGMLLNITDSIGKIITFEFDDDDSTTAGNVGIPIQASESLMAEKILQKVTGSFSGSMTGSLISAGAADGTCVLTQSLRARTNLGNTTIDGSVSSADVTIVNFNGGAGFLFQNSDEHGTHGISTVRSDGLLTSGSFTYEGLYDWEHGYIGAPESLIRLVVTGTTAPSNTESVIANLVGTSTRLDLFISDSPTSTDVKHLFLTGANVFDKDIWGVSFGRRAPHDLGATTRHEYFLRATKQESGRLLESYHTASHYADQSDSVFNNATDTYNSSGSILVIGEQTLQGGSSGKFLNNSTGADTYTLAHSSSFTGLISNLRFWSRYTSDTEWKERAKNYVSVGLDNPSVNYNFTSTTTGSFERLRVHTFGKQATTSSDASGGTMFFDFSQNNNHLVGSNFEPSKTVFKALRADYEILSEKFDLNYAKTKVRVRSFQDPTLIDDSKYCSVAPAYEVAPSEEVVDDNRLSIDMSVMKGLNENILTMFSDFGAIDNALGRPNLIFGASYPELSHYRTVYFNNVLERMDLSKYRTLFKWIDNAFTDMMYDLVPRTTNFMGINFIYESHVLERHRLQYTFDEIYLKALPRDPSRGNLLLSQFVGVISKF